MGTESKLGELVPCGGGDSIPLLKPQLLVGRRSQCDVVLRFPNVSSHHCELEFLDGYWHVRDLNSRNGIKVNDDRCKSKWLMPGDVLSVAKHKFEVVYTPQGDAPPPETEEDPFSKSLMEKAGLQQSDEPAPRPRSSPAPGPDAYKIDADDASDADDDQAMQWLMDDDDRGS